MSREIEFRGKRVDNNEFIFGSLIVDEISDKHYIAISVEKSERIGEEGCLKVISCEVDKETVGQYTGVKDKNGKEIYEGDILKDEFNRIFIVYWVEKEARFSMRQKNRKTEYFMFINHLSEEVIGNIYDNPELWEKGDNQC